MDVIGRTERLCALLSIVVWLYRGSPGGVLDLSYLYL